MVEQVEVVLSYPAPMLLGNGIGGGLVPGHYGRRDVGDGYYTQTQRRQNRPNVRKRFYAPEAAEHHVAHERRQDKADYP